jgi:hypothetical protein
LKALLYFAVSKTTKELVLKWKEDNPVDISSEVKMPQFELFRIVPSKCQETFHIGKNKSMFLCWGFWDRLCFKLHDA